MSEKTEPPRMGPTVESRLTQLAIRLIDQERAHVLIPPNQPAYGYWFGGGNVFRSPSGSFILSGRYRNSGDSRTGLDAGARGLECAVFEGATFHGPFTKIHAWSKADFSVGAMPVVSIEGTALRFTGDGVELFVSTEREQPYPEAIAEYQKPGTGVWSIDVLRAPDVNQLDPSRRTRALASTDPVSLHIKDPVVADDGGDETRLFFCVHPFNWSCSYTGLAVRPTGDDHFTVRDSYVLPRGHVWDVAATRITGRISVPRLGCLAGMPPLSLYFYDGAECVREHEQNPRAVYRPRGYSCEELGGLAWGWDATFPRMQRLSELRPFFISPHGTGCSRYVSTLRTRDALYAVWQQSQPDRSQPLVGHALSMQEVAAVLT